MKYLKIRNGKGFFRKNDVDVELDRLTKEDLLHLISLAESPEFEMDAYDESLLQNRAHQIIYQSIEAKISAFRLDIKRFSNEVENLYLDAVREYQADVSAEQYEEDEATDGEEA
jgi:hypothetical protein